MIAGCLFLHSHYVCVHVPACVRFDFVDIGHHFRYRHLFFSFCSVSPPDCSWKKLRFFSHAYTHFNWSFEVVPNNSLFPAQSFTFYRVRFFLSLSRLHSDCLEMLFWFVISSILLDFDIPIVCTDSFFPRFRSFVNTNKTSWEAWMRAEFQSHHSIGPARMFGDYTKEILIIANILIHHLVPFYTYNRNGQREIP